MTATQENSLDSLLQQARAAREQGRLSDAEGLLRRALSDHPGAALAHFHLASLCQARNRPADALEHYRAGLLTAPGNAQALTNMGGLLLESGRFEEARNCLEQAIAAKPDLAAAQANLGEACRALDRHSEAAAAYRRSLALRPGNPAPHFGLAVSLAALDRLEEAIAACRAGLELRPANLTARRVLAELLRRAGQDDEALAVLRQIDPAGIDDPRELAALAALARDLGELPVALGAYGRLVRATPENPRPWQELSEVLRLLRFGSYDSEAESMLTACFERDDLDHQDLAGAAMSLLIAKPGLRPFFAQADGKQADVQQTPEPGDAFSPDLLAALEDRLLLALLASSITADARFEKALTALRDRLVQYLPGYQVAPAALAALEPFAFALARQCFLTEYVFAGSGGDRADLAEVLALAGGAGPWESPRRLAWALLACYAPLGRFEGLPELAPEAAEADPRIAGLIRQQIDEPREEVQIRASIPVLSAIEDGVSQEVRRFYEETPYPRWSNLKRIEGRPLEAFLRWLFPGLPAESLGVPEAPRVLIAGCGTGRHALLTAQFFRSAQVLAVDLSLTSLAYAIRKSRDLGIANVDFAQADLHLLDATIGDFDLIESSGVLVCVEDPLEGWRALCRRLKPGGFMKLALYSEAARRHVVAARDFIAQGGYGSSPDEIRRCRQDIMASTDPLLRSVAEGRDFFSTSMVRDLIFHIKEHRFTIPWIAEGVATLGLEFLGFEIADPVIRQRYHTRFPNDPDMASFDSWIRYEEEFPGSFSEMYQFWMRRPSEAVPDR